MAPTLELGASGDVGRDLLRVRRCAECGILGCCLVTILFSKFVGRGLRSASGAPSHMLYTLPAEGGGHGSRAAALARLAVFRFAFRHAGLAVPVVRDRALR